MSRAGPAAATAVSFVRERSDWNCLMADDRMHRRLAAILVADVDGGHQTQVITSRWDLRDIEARGPGPGMSRFLLNIEKRSLPRLMLSGDGVASKDAV
jgi:hypothetical protein